jgi:hypothetical protein
MVGYTLLLVILTINCVIYWLIDAYFLYAEALHSHSYKSIHYTQQKKIAQKKFLKEGYVNV